MLNYILLIFMILVVLAQRFEEIEAFTVVDVLRRANVDVDTVGINSTVIDGAHSIRIVTDKKLNEIDMDEYNGIILPGGPGHQRLMKSQRVLDIVKDFDEKNKLIGAICAAPRVLAKAGVLEDKIATVYPGYEKDLPKPREGKVVVNKNVVTSPGPGTVILFSLKLVEILKGKKVAERLKRKLLVD